MKLQIPPGFVFQYVFKKKVFRYESSASAHNARWKEKFGGAKWRMANAVSRPRISEFQTSSSNQTKRRSVSGLGWDGCMGRKALRFWCVDSVNTIFYFSIDRFLYLKARLY